jgi:hypothetical protein
MVPVPQLVPRLHAYQSIIPVTLILLISACHPGTPAPPFTTSYDSVASDTLLSYIENDLEFDTFHAVGDAQRLAIGCPGQCLHGPLVKIEPERRAHRNKLSALTSGPGRIIARMINYDTLEYPKLNLGSQDTVYWAITDATPTSNPDSLTSTSLFISIKGLRGTRTPAITDTTGFVERHPSSYYGNRALAHWVWSDLDETGWGSCSKGACCH